MNILTFDIEDWYNHDDYSRDFNWDKHEIRIYRGVEKILYALSERNLKGTFFCLGWIAEHHPKVIRQIAEAGHHLGCHSYQHELATRFTPEEFRQDTYKAKCLIEDVLGMAVDAYRVPSFSITRDNLWTFDIIAELGFKYDCSVFPGAHEFGGISTFPASPTLLETHNGILKEFPIGLGRIFNKKIIYSGGGYFRIMPYKIIISLTKKNNYVMAYFHPSDFDPGQPLMPHLSRMRQFKNRVGLSGAYDKFRKYIINFDFVNLPVADSNIEWSKVQAIYIDELR